MNDSKDEIITIKSYSCCFGVKKLTCLIYLNCYVCQLCTKGILYDQMKVDPNEIYFRVQKGFF